MHFVIAIFSINNIALHIFQLLLFQFFPILETICALLRRSFQTTYKDVLKPKCAPKPPRWIPLRFKGWSFWEDSPTLVIFWVTRSFRRASMTGLCLEYSSYRLIPMWKRSQLGYDSAISSTVGLNSSTVPSPVLDEGRKGGKQEWRMSSNIFTWTVTEHTTFGTNKKALGLSLTWLQHSYTAPYNKTFKGTLSTRASVENTCSRLWLWNSCQNLPVELWMWKSSNTKQLLPRSMVNMWPKILHRSCNQRSVTFVFVPLRSVKFKMLYFSVLWVIKGAICTEATILQFCSQYLSALTPCSFEKPNAPNKWDIKTCGSTGKSLTLGRGTMWTKLAWSLEKWPHQHSGVLHVLSFKV